MHGEGAVCMERGPSSWGGSRVHGEGVHGGRSSAIKRCYATADELKDFPHKFAVGLHAWMCLQITIVWMCLQLR